ncbi:hypothetical protein BUALT_Bualt11G0059400 [Buddleja alternifolia]|uniref:RING-type E3 ubiquitin transferase n=1 Tax=Buddleja alternifolia TaxID=168488 RepID=A0AAV6WZ78_9LAMI|nr:hypothetical protein BUALT_Bualt11G0059400 [Buddleja alternifolia]
MVRFCVGRRDGIDDVVEEGPSNTNNRDGDRDRDRDRPLPKKPRTSDNLIVYHPRRPNSGNPNSPPPLSFFQQRLQQQPDPIVEDDDDSENFSFIQQLLHQQPDPIVEDDDDSEDPSYDDDDESGPSFYEDQSEEEQQQQEEAEQLQNGGAEVQPTEARLNSTPTEIRTARESTVARVETPTPLSVTLTDPDVLDCPICLEPLSSPVYQCENGHIACASCCTKMRNKCASCCWPIGYNRCRAIEKVLESIQISCRYKHHGCKESLNYSKKLDHEKTCIFTPCSCPNLGCNYVGPSLCLYTHFALQHSTSSRKFCFNIRVAISLDNNQKHVFLQESNESTLFILNRRIEPFGSCVSVICISPSSSRKGFRYEVKARDGESSINLKTMVESTREWIAEVPAKRCLLVPSDFMSLNGQLKLELLIYRDRK